jgi:protein phosphatase
MQAVSKTVRSFGATDVGKRRATNEDAFLADDALGLYVVADGMGGHAAGEIASQEAVETIHGMVKQGLRALPQLVGPLTNERCRLPPTWCTRWRSSTATNPAWARR